MSSQAVLIVEDDTATAELERRVLMRSGRSVRMAQGVAEAIEMLNRDTFGVVLLDYNLPDGDPWSVVDVAQQRVPRVPVIVVTAMGNERVAAEALHHGVAEYVQKTDAFWNLLPEVVARVSANAQADERVRRSDALFRLIAQSATDLVATTDLAGVIQEVSAACRSMLGYEPEEMIGKPVVSFVHPDDRERLSSAFAAQTHLRLTYRHIKKDGRELWVEANSSVVRDPATGQAREIVGIVRDIHERKRAEEKFRALIEGAPEANVILDRDHRIVLVNARVERLFGHERSTLAGQPFSLLLTDPSRCPNLMERETGSGAIELLARRNDGSQFLAEISVNRLETDGELLVSSTILDVSDRKALQDQHMLVRLGEQLPRFEEVQPLAQYVVEELGKYFDCARCAFTENDYINAQFIVHGEYRRVGPVFTGVHPLSAYTPNVRSELEVGRAVVISDAASDPRTVGVYGAYVTAGIRSMAAVPLMREGRWLAAIYVCAENVRYWTSREIQMLQALAERVWLWIEHVRMLGQLRASERKYRHFIETTREGVWEIDGEGRTVFVNPRMESLLGYSASEMMGQPLQKFMDQEGVAATPAHVERRKAGLSEAHDFKFIRKDGKALWVRLETNPLRNEHGDYTGALAMVADITERRQAERDQAFLLELAELVSSANDQAVVFEQVSKRLGEHLGVDRCLFTEFDASLESASTRHEWYKPELAPLAGRYLLSGFGQSLTLIFAGRSVIVHDCRSDERTRSSYNAYAALGIRSVIAVPMFRDAQLSAAMVLINVSPRIWTPRDTSLAHATVERVALCIQRLQSIAALRDMSRELERRVEARTAELQDTLSEKEVLLKEIHHRVKNNLQVISSMLNLQAMHINDPGARSVLTESRGRVQSIALVHEILYESHDLSRVNFVDYIHTLVNTILQAQSSSERRIDARIDAQAVRLPVGAAIPCGLIINELVTNSLKHAFVGRESGSIIVRLRTRDVEWVELEVADDGVGLPKDLDLRRLGSLGLDLVYTFAEQLGGQVEVKSESGTEFRIVFQDHQG